MFTKAGETGVVKSGKTIPVLGGLVGGAFDGATTNTMGNIAIKIIRKDKIQCQK